MEIVIVVLLIVAIAIFGLSFMQRDRVKEIEQEVDHLQLTAMQEIYRLKKKVRVLEEELLQTDEFALEDVSEELDQNIMKQVLSKHENGMSNDAIAKAEHLTVEEVKLIVKQNERVSE